MTNEQAKAVLVDRKDLEMLVYIARKHFEIHQNTAARLLSIKPEQVDAWLREYDSKR